MGSSPTGSIVECAVLSLSSDVILGSHICRDKCGDLRATRNECFNFFISAIPAVGRQIVAPRAKKSIGKDTGNIRAKLRRCPCLLILLRKSGCRLPFKFGSARRVAESSVSPEAFCSRVSTRAIMYTRARGVVVSHPLSMREALGSIPSVSKFLATPV